jgi:hypothetical protein
MGEATYYLMAEFGSEEEAERAARYAAPILREMAEFNDAWQEIRHERDRPVAERHEALLSRFPLVRRFVRLPGPREDDPNMNYLAGECEMGEDFQLVTMGSRVGLSCVVWHLASWDNVEEVFYGLGARKVYWTSDEYIDPWDLVGAYLDRMEVPERRPEPFDREELEIHLIAHEIGRGGGPPFGGAWGTR